MVNKELTFWEHVEELRKMLWRALIVVMVFTIAFFCLMPMLFDKVILAPCSSDFIFYRALCRFFSYFSYFPDFCQSGFNVPLININLTSQFLVHISTSAWLALVCSFPILLYLIWTFVRDAFYSQERRYVCIAFIFGCLLFFAGIAIGYFFVFPLTLRFLAGYQLSTLIPNQISLDSYISNFLIVIFMMGALFELPMLCWLLSGLGLLHRSFFQKYRRHAIVALLVVAAVVTPTGDPFTLMVVFLPVYALYELSALLVKK